MGTALMMEGLLSACYHVCPNYTNFQFGERGLPLPWLNLNRNLPESAIPIHLQGLGSPRHSHVGDSRAGGLV